MYSSTLTFGSTRDSSRELERLGEELASAEAVVVGAGAGLSTAAGFSYSGERFERDFSAWGARYGFHDFYTGGFHPYGTLNEFWGFWAKSILLNRYEAGVGELYRRLMSLLVDKDYFVLTTNVDHQFQLAGIDRARLFYTQGDYGLFQCSKPCHAQTYDNEAQVRAMAVAVDEKIGRQRAARVPERLWGLSVPDELIPRCPVCGRPMTTNLRCDDGFVEDDGWHAASARYDAFLRARKRARVLYLELGVGQNTPGIIKYPFWRMCARNPRAAYACVNLGEAYAPSELASRSILIDGDLGEAIGALAGS